MKILNSKYLKLALLLLTLIAFIYYYINNSSKFEVVFNLQWWQLFLIIIGQSIVIVSNVLILIIFVLFLKKNIKISDSAKITAYSSLVNFFGFLQGGLGLRGLYLKSKFGMSLKKYFSLTLLQYLILFGIASAMILIGFILQENISLASILWSAVVLSTLSLLILAIYKIPNTLFGRVRSYLKKLKEFIETRLILFLVLAVIIQLSGSFLASFIELQAVGADISLSGLLIYSGVSQFAIVIAVTPGAIGIREGLLLIVQQQMQLSLDSIVLAATLDRSIYFITLGLITPLAMSFKKNKKQASI